MTETKELIKILIDAFFELCNQEGMPDWQDILTEEKYEILSDFYQETDSK